MMETSALMLNLMRMSRETISGNKLLVAKLGNILPTGIVEIRASTIGWILNVSATDDYTSHAPLISSYSRFLSKQLHILSSYILYLFSRLLLF